MLTVGDAPQEWDKGMSLRGLGEREDKQPGPSAKVLVVDDEPSIVEIVAYLLEDAGREVLRAYDGTQALALAREHRPCLIVTDLMMPVMDGGALIRAVRDETALAGTSIVLMSAASRLRMEQLGADVVLPKPFNIDVLDDVLARLLASK